MKRGEGGGGNDIRQERRVSALKFNRMWPYKETPYTRDIMRWGGGGNLSQIIKVNERGAETSEKKRVDEPLLLPSTGGEKPPLLNEVRGEGPEAITPSPN